MDEEDVLYPENKRKREEEEEGERGTPPKHPKENDELQDWERIAWFLLSMNDPSWGLNHETL